MNNKIREFVKKYNLKVSSYKKYHNIIILNTDNGKFVLKKGFRKEEDLYKYLSDRNFDYIIETKRFDDVDFYYYIDELQVPSAEKAKELVYVLSKLHNKTTFYKEQSLDSIKKIYEELVNRCIYLEKYYFDLQDIIEQKVYMSPAEYLLIRNISLIYSALNYSKDQLDKWYSLKKNNTRERVVLLHKRPSLDHFLFGNDKKLISWRNSSRDIPIYDFIYLYKHEYLNLEMIDLFEMYQSKFKFSEDEKLLFFAIISIPKKIKYTGNNYLDCYNTSKIIKYVIKTRDFVLYEGDKKQKAD